MLQQGLDLPLEILRIHRIDLGRDLERDARCTCQADRQIGALLRRDAAKKRQVAAARVLSSLTRRMLEEDEHLYHTAGWCRELWLKSLGLKAVLPPPEEKKHVTSAIGAARAEQAAHPK